MGRSQTLFHSRVWTTTHPTMRVIFLIGILLAVAVTAENAEFEEVEASTAVKAPEMELPQMKAQAKNVRGCTRRCAKNRCSVTVFQHCSYRGYRINLPPGSYGMHALMRKGMRNDDLSSIQVHGPCRAQLFEHAWLNGKVLTRTSNDSCFTNDRLRLLQLPQGQTKAKMNKDFKIVVTESKPEDSQEMELAQTKTSWGRRRRRRYVSWNDQVSSIRVNTGTHCWWDCRERNSKERLSKERKLKAEKAMKRKAEKDAKAKKERNAKKEGVRERAAKERSKKERAKKELATKERSKKERAKKEKAKKEKINKERRSKEHRRKEIGKKERTAKERNVKEVKRKEHKNKEV